MKEICSSPTSSPLPPPAVFICQFWHIDCLFEIDVSKRQKSYPHAPSAKPKGDSQHEMHISEPDAKASFKALEGQTSTFVTRDEQVQTISCCAQFVSNYWGVSSHHSHYMDSNLNKPLNLSTSMPNLSHTGCTTNINETTHYAVRLLMIGMLLIFITDRKCWKIHIDIHYEGPGIIEIHGIKCIHLLQNMCTKFK